AGSSEAFFEQLDDQDRDKNWLQAFLKIQRQIKKDNPLFPILSLHVVYLWKKRFFSCVDWNILTTLQPSVIVTLIDDIYDIKGRIETNQKAAVTMNEDDHSLLAILSWRLREIHTCNLIAKHLYVNPERFPSIDNLLLRRTESMLFDVTCLDEIEQIFGKPLPHYVISVKQSLNDLYRLLFERKKIRIYYSFPISAPRKENDKDYFKKLQEWRLRMHKEFVVFDPLAIDELRFNMDENDNVIEDKLKKRIPYRVGRPIVLPPSIPINSFPKQELQTISNLVVQQVSERDYKLVSQAQLVVMWRPLYKGRTHAGVESEGVYAATKGIPVHSYHPKEDRQSNKPFPAHFGVAHLNVEELFQTIKKFQEGLEKKQKEDTHRKEI
ncbi:MAG: hypothetical protein KKD69_06590, partial [Euryarchaeota archaeon]|nr:hypothetical protein [Euryarchaeota archaeon]